MKYIFIVILYGLFLMGCQVESSNSLTQSSSFDITSISTTEDKNARVLAAQCAGCHGTNGISVTSWDSIAGEGEFSHESFTEYPIMQAQTYGYTNEQKQLIDSLLNRLGNGGDDD